MLLFNYICNQKFIYAIITEKRNQEIQETMLKARDSKCSVPIRYGKVLFCGAAAAGKSNFLKLLMKEDFQPLHISTEVLKPQQVTMAVKALMSSNDDEVEFTTMSIDDEIIQLESYLPKEYTTLTIPPKQIPVQASSQDKPSTDDLQKIYTTSAAPLQESFLQAACDKEMPSIDHLPKNYTSTTASLDQKSLQVYLQYIEGKHSEEKNKLALANVKIE